MRTEITKIHHRLATTFIYVTHDQTEAMTMGTRIVVMKDGIVQQVDTPTTLYDNPANLFVACFLGSPQMNIFKAKIVEENGKVYALIGETNKVLIPQARAKRIIDNSIFGSEVLLGIRPEDVRYEQALIEAHPESVIEATVDVIENLGNETILYLNIEGKDDYTIARVNSRYVFSQGDRVKMYLATEHAHLFDPTTELTLMGVPDYNLIPAQCVAVDGGLEVIFGDTHIPLPKSLIERITDKSVINNAVTLGLAPKTFKAEEDFIVPEPVAGEEAAESAEAVAAEVPNKDDYIKIEGVAEFFDDYPRFRAVYATVSGMRNYMIAARPLDANFSAGKPVTYYIDPNTIQLFNEDGERLVADAPVSDNGATGTAVNNQGVYNYRVAAADGRKNKFAYENFVMEPDASGAKQKKELFDDLKTSETDTAINIDRHGFSIDKEVIAKTPKMVVSGNITRLDEYRRDAIITVDVPGFNGEVTAIIRNFSGYNTGDKIKFAINPHAVRVGDYVTMDRAIANAQDEGEARRKEIDAARAKERELENAAKKPKAAPKAEQAAAADEPKAAAKPKAEKPKKPPVKKPVAKKK